MSNKVIGDYTAAVTIDGSAHFLLIQPGNSSTAYNKISRNVFLAITGNPVGTSDTQALTNKTLGNTNTITVKDTLLTLQDDGDTSKQAQFQLSGITTATTRTYTLPDATTTLVGTGVTQTLTNKTLTSPTISGGTIDNATVTVDAVAGHTAATTGTIYGISITGAKMPGTNLTNSSVTTSQIASSTITAANVDWSQTGSTGMWWQELGRSTLGSSNATITVSSFTAKKFLLIQITVLASSSVGPLLTFNNDSGANYAVRFSVNNGAQTTSVSQTSMTLMAGSVSTPSYQVLFVANNSANEKLVMGGSSLNQNTAGAANAPSSFDVTGKWANTAAQITRVDVTTATNTFLTGSSVVVLGHD